MKALEQDNKTQVRFQLVIFKDNLALGLVG